MVTFRRSRFDSHVSMVTFRYTRFDSHVLKTHDGSGAHEGCRVALRKPMRGPVPTRGVGCGFENLRALRSPRVVSVLVSKTHESSGAHEGCRFSFLKPKRGSAPTRGVGCRFKNPLRGSAPTRGVVSLKTHEKVSVFVPKTHEGLGRRRGRRCSTLRSTSRSTS